MTSTGINELRKDPLLGRWIAVLSRSRQPAEYVLNAENSSSSSCVLCPGREKETPPEIMSIPRQVPGQSEHSWWTRVIPNLDPVFKVEGDLGRKGEGMYDRMNSIGANEIIIESPQHSIAPEDLDNDQMRRVVLTYRDRLTDLEKDHRLRYTLIYKNVGKSAGSVMSHPCAHVASTPVIPKRVKEELDNAKGYFAYKERCIFCDIMREEVRAGSRIILETGSFVAFCPFASKFPFESWIVPKRHSCAFQEITDDETRDMAAVLSTVLKKMKKIFSGLSYNYFIHSAPNRIPRKNHWHTLGEDYHWHLEIMPRLLVTSGFEWGSGFYILPTSPEDAAKYLREV